MRLSAWARWSLSKSRFMPYNARKYRNDPFVKIGMSALGQKQTCAVHQSMSALPPIATAKADFRKSSCLLYPRKRTCAVHYPMSALPPKATSNATYGNVRYEPKTDIPLLDDLVGCR